VYGVFMCVWGACHDNTLTPMIPHEYTRYYTLPHAQGSTHKYPVIYLLLLLLLWLLLLHLRVCVCMFACACVCVCERGTKKQKLACVYRARGGEAHRAEAAVRVGPIPFSSVNLVVS